MTLITWLLSHPLHVVTIVVSLLCTAWVIGAAVWALALAHEQRKEAEQRERLERAIRAAQSEDQNLHLLRASRPTQAAGLKREQRRVG